MALFKREKDLSAEAFIKEVRAEREAREEKARKKARKEEKKRRRQQRIQQAKEYGRKLVTETLPTIIIDSKDLIKGPAGKAVAATKTFFVETVPKATMTIFSFFRGKEKSAVSSEEEIERKAREFWVKKTSTKAERVASAKPHLEKLDEFEVELFNPEQRIFDSNIGETFTFRAGNYSEQSRPLMYEAMFAPLAINFMHNYIRMKNGLSLLTGENLSRAESIPRRIEMEKAYSFLKTVLSKRNQFIESLFDESKENGKKVFKRKTNFSSKERIRLRELVQEIKVNFNEFLFQYDWQLYGLASAVEAGIHDKKERGQIQVFDRVLQRNRKAYPGEIQDASLIKLFRKLMERRLLQATGKKISLRVSSKQRRLKKEAIRKRKAS